MTTPNDEDPPVTVQRMNHVVPGRCKVRIPTICKAPDDIGPVFEVADDRGRLKVCLACLNEKVARKEWGILGERPSDRRNQSEIEAYVNAVSAKHTVSEKQIIAKDYAGSRWGICAFDTGGGIVYGRIWVTTIQLGRVSVSIGFPDRDNSLGEFEVGPPESPEELQLIDRCHLFLRSRRP